MKNESLFDKVILIEPKMKRIREDDDEDVSSSKEIRTSLSKDNREEIVIVNRGTEATEL